jgi:hypothetical protein
MSDLPFVIAVFGYAMAFLAVAIVAETIIERRTK